MEYKKINKENWEVKPLTPEQKRSYIARLIVVLLMIGFMFIIYMLAGKFGIEEKYRFRVALRTSIIIPTLAFGLQMTGVPVFYKKKEGQKIMSGQIIWILTMSAIYINAFPLLIKLLKYNIANTYIYIIFAIQFVLMSIATYFFVKMEPEEKERYKKTFFWHICGLLSLVAIQIMFIVKGIY